MQAVEDDGGRHQHLQSLLNYVDRQRFFVTYMICLIVILMAVSEFYKRRETWPFDD